MSAELLSEIECLSGGSGSFTALKSYISRLIEQGCKLPNSKGDINRTLIAKECGFDRQALYPKRGSAATIKLLNWAIERVGIDEKQTASTKCDLDLDLSDRAVSKLINDNKKKDDRISKLENDLLLSAQTITELRDKVGELNRIIKRNNIIQDTSVSGDDIVLP